VKRLQLAIADRLVFCHWRAALGGRIRAIISGSATLPPRLAGIFWAARMPVYEGYGPTEASPVISVNYPVKGRYKIGTVGPIISGGEVRIAEDGEILYRGPNVMMGYYHRPELTSEVIDGDGWLHTGDLGTIDADGYLRIVGRIKDMFIVGGFNAYPAEIENLMLRHPRIAQVAVIGVPDERLGEVAKAFVVLEAGPPIEPAAIVDWARAEMANFKAPRAVEFLDALPVNATGKVVKDELRERA
jgi:fatty-acyl-CoA synthase